MPMLFKPTFFQTAKKVTLTSREKLGVQNQLQAFMQAHPAKSPQETNKIDRPVSVSFISTFASIALRPIPIALLVALLLGSGTAFAAEFSLPNDVLYPLKIQVNERVRAVLTPTNAGKAKWAAQVAERRLEEVEKLAMQKKLVGQTQLQTESTFDAQTKLVQEKIAALKAEGNITTAVDLSNSYRETLRTHETILTELNAQNKDQTVLDPLLEKMKRSVAALTTEIQALEASTSTNTNTESTPTAEKEPAAIKNAQELPQDTAPPVESKGIDLKGTFTEKSIPPIQSDINLKIDPPLENQPQIPLSGTLKTDPFVPEEVQTDKAKLDLGF